MKKFSTFLSIAALCLLPFTQIHAQEEPESQPDLSAETVLSSDSVNLVEEENHTSPIKSQAPEIKFFNPWLLGEEAELKEFLSQNWKIEDFLQQRNDLALAIAASDNSDREFKRDTELLTRNPGFEAIYSAYCIFPRLLITQTQSSAKSIRKATEMVIERKLMINPVLNFVSTEIDNGIESMAVYEKLCSRIESQLADFSQINDRKTTVARLHSLVKEQNSTILSRLLEQNKALKKLISQHLLQMKSAMVQMDYLKELNNPPAVIVSSRLARVANSLKDTIENDGRNYFNNLIGFSVGLKNLVKKNFEEIESFARENERNIFHIKEFLGKFPQRDIHPQQTHTFVYDDILLETCNMLDKQQTAMYEAGLGEKGDENLFRKEFFDLISYFSSNKKEFKGFKELFNSYYGVKRIADDEVEIANDEEKAEEVKPEDNVEN